MLVIRIALGRWIYELDFGPRPDDDDHVCVPDPELEFGFVAPKGDDDGQ